MSHIYRPLVFLYCMTVLAVDASRSGRGGRERGDVPGWVMITLMTAALAALLFGIAGPRLVELFERAIARVSTF